MKKLIIDDQELYIKIIKKPNKNTYFYFKKDNYIEVRLSINHTEKYIMNHIKANGTYFLNKLQKATKKPIDESKYFLFGKELDKFISEDYKEILITENEIKLPVNHTDQLKAFEKKQILNILHNLQLKYQHNPYVNIDNITLKTRYTTSRFGSCNARKRNINISTHLVHYDVTYIEYVFLHEISHLTHQNHGPKFYQLLEQLCPNHLQLRKELRNKFR